MAVLRAAGALVRTVWSLEPLPLRVSAKDDVADGLTKRLRRHFLGVSPSKPNVAQAHRKLLHKRGKRDSDSADANVDADFVAD